MRVHQSVVAESWDSKGALDFQHYKGVEGHARSPGIRLGRGTSRSSLNLHPKQTTKWLVHIPGHPWVLGQATGTLTHKTHHGPDSGVSHHLPPYSILCVTPRRLHPNGSFSRDSQVGVPKLSRNCPGWSPGTLGAHNSRLRDRIATRSEPKLYPSSRSFQRHVSLSIRRSGRGRFPTFSGLESNCQFDSRPFFCP